MKKLLIATIAIVLISLSCKKSGSSSGSYYFKGSANDTALTFNVNATAILDSTGGFTTLALTGNVSSAANLQGLTLDINNTPSGKPIVAGTYTETNMTDFVVGGVYNPGGTSVVYGAGEFGTPTNPLTITISSIDKNTVKGTFSGDFFYTDITTGYVGMPIKTFTNGQFDLKIATR
jgi:hypothetical protein